MKLIINGKTFLLKKKGDYVGETFVINYTSQKHRIKCSLKVDQPMILKEAILVLPYTFSTEEVFLNGFQTWSTSQMKSIQSKDKKVSFLLNALQGNYGDYQLTEYSYLHSWSYTYLKKEQYYRVLGSLNEKNAFRIFEFDPGKNQIRIKLDIEQLKVNNSFELFHVYDLEGCSDQVVDAYFEQIPQKSKLPKRKYYGWTSWYHYYTNISEAIVTENLEAYDTNELPIDYFQVDDGYQRAVGDWLESNDSFPNGMKVVAEKIHSKGFKAGIWLAPLICEKKSLLYKKHNDWLLRDSKGKLVKGGFNHMWSGFFYILDITKKEVRTYLKKVFHTITYEWGYDLLKLDFLYVLSRYTLFEKTRGQIFYETMSFLKEISGEAHIIGCGVPVVSTYGVFEFCRVSSDVGLTWEDRFLKKLRFKERVSTINAITSTINRRHINHKTLINDPDVFILREDNQKMSWNQRRTLYFVNLLFGGLIFTSDNIHTYTQEQLELLKFGWEFRQMELQEVTIDKTITAEVRVEDRTYFFFINLQPTSVTVDNKNEKLLHQSVQLEGYETKYYLR